MENRIDERHRKELLKFLLVKTAAVRRGIKPAELLRVRHCYEGVNAEGMRICLYRSDIYGVLGLDYIELKVENQSSLVLFYNPRALAGTLAAAEADATAAFERASGFADSFCVAAETIANAAKDAGATLVGEVLKLDDTNEADQTDGKIAAWLETIKA